MMVGIFSIVNRKDIARTEHKNPAVEVITEGHCKESRS